MYKKYPNKKTLLKKRVFYAFFWYFRISLQLPSILNQP